MPDRFSELLGKAQSGPLTAEESEELAGILNAPILPPSGHSPPGFVSKHTFEPRDLPTRIGAIRWFANCGKPLALDLTMKVDRARSWPMAMQACQSAAWENVELEAQNQLHMWLHQNDPDRCQAWNDIVTVHKTEVIAPLIKEKLAPFPARAWARCCVRGFDHLGCVGSADGEFLFELSPSGIFLSGAALGLRGGPFSLRLARRLAGWQVGRLLN